MQGTVQGRLGQVGRFRVALQSQVKRLWHNGNRKKPPLLFTAHWHPQDPLPKGWNANPNTKTAW